MFKKLLMLLGITMVILAIMKTLQERYEPLDFDEPDRNGSS